MTRSRIALTYTLAAAAMAALGAATAVAIVALEERSSRRLGDGGRDDPLQLLDDDERALGIPSSRPTNPRPVGANPPNPPGEATP